MGTYVGSKARRSPKDAQPAVGTAQMASPTIICQHNAYIILQAGSRGVGRGIARTKGHLVLILLAHFGFRVPPRQTPNACMLRLSAPVVNADGELAFDFSKYGLYCPSCLLTYALIKRKEKTLSRQKPPTSPFQGLQEVQVQQQLGCCCGKPE